MCHIAGAIGSSDAAIELTSHLPAEKDERNHIHIKKNSRYKHCTMFNQSSHQAISIPSRTVRDFPSSPVSSQSYHMPSPV